MTLSFVVPRKPVSVNAGYIRAGWRGNCGPGGGKGLVLSKEARDFKDAVKAYAFAAARSARWPRPEVVERVAVEITVFNTRHDVDAPAKFCLDAMEGVVYVNDRCARPVTCDKRSDDGKPRVAICVSLEAVRV